MFQFGGGGGGGQNRLVITFGGRPLQQQQAQQMQQQQMALHPFFFGTTSGYNNNFYNANQQQQQQQQQQPQSHVFFGQGHDPDDLEHSQYDGHEQDQYTDNLVYDQQQHQQQRSQPQVEGQSNAYRSQPQHQQHQQQLDPNPFGPVDHDEQYQYQQQQQQRQPQQQPFMFSNHNSAYSAGAGAGGAGGGFDIGRFFRNAWGFTGVGSQPQSSQQHQQEDDDDEDLREKPTGPFSALKSVLGSGEREYQMRKMPFPSLVDWIKYEHALLSLYWIREWDTYTRPLRLKSLVTLLANSFMWNALFLANYSFLDGAAKWGIQISVAVLVFVLSKLIKWGWETAGNPGIASFICVKVMNHILWVALFQVGFGLIIALAVSKQSFGSTCLNWVLSQIQSWGVDLLVQPIFWYRAKKKREKQDQELLEKRARRGGAKRADDEGPDYQELSDVPLTENGVGNDSSSLYVAPRSANVSFPPPFASSQSATSSTAAPHEMFSDFARSKSPPPQNEYIPPQPVQPSGVAGAGGAQADVYSPYRSDDDDEPLTTAQNRH